MAITIHDTAYKCIITQFLALYVIRYLPIFIRFTGGGKSKKDRLYFAAYIPGEA